MAITLAEAAKLSNDILLKGIIETIIRDSPILAKMPFIQVVGNSLKYNREKTLPSAAWYTVGDTWAESTPTFEQVSTALTILGGDADVDNFLKATRSNVNDLEAAVIEAKVKAIRHEFEDKFVYGTGSNNQPTGLWYTLKGTAWQASTAYAVGDVVVPTSGKENGFRYECTTAGTSGSSEPTWPTSEGATKTDGTVTWTTRPGCHLGSGTNGASLTLSILDQLIDLVRGGKPDILMMSRRSRRKIMALARAAGTNLLIGEGKLGEMVEYYNGIPVVINDFIKDNHAVGSSSDCSLIFALQLGEGAVCGLTSPEMIQVERVGSLETKDATRTRIKWYCGLAVFSYMRAAVLSGVRD